MISAVVSLLKPLYQPVLKLQMTAPELPEGSTLVRHLKPDAAWLTLKYVGACLGMVGQLVGAAALGIAAIAGFSKNGHLAIGVLLAVLVWLVAMGFLGFVLVAARLDFELRHYLVGDRSLRVSHGAITHHEVTLSYANVQNLEVKQGPIESLFGLKSLTVSTAGGAAVSAQAGGGLNQVTLEGLTNADEVRQLILGMLQRHKDAGLGEPEPAAHRHAELGSGAALAQLRQAAERLARAADRLQ